MALTKAIIAELWTAGETVQVATPEDWNVLVSYLKENPTADAMRYAELIEDLDFLGKDIEYWTTTDSNAMAQYFTLDGKNHTIKNIELYSEKANIILINGHTISGGSNAHTSLIKNLKIDNCYFCQISNNLHLFVIHCGDIKNCSVTNCKFEVNQASIFYGNGTSSYGSIQKCSSNNQILVIGITQTSFYGSVIANCICKNIYTVESAFATTIQDFDDSGNRRVHCISRSKFILDKQTKETRVCAFGGNTQNHATIRECYAANEIVPTTDLTLTKYRPMIDDVGKTVLSYYDKELPSIEAVVGTNWGLTTAELKSVETMTEKGWDIEEVE